MPSNTEITVSQLQRLVGLPNAPTLIDVRIPDDIAADPRFMPCAEFRSHKDVASWARAYQGANVVVSCQRGLKLSQGVAAWLRTEGIDAQTLEGGHEAWCDAGAPLIDPAHLPARQADGTTLWVTRARPKIDRIACPG